MADSRIYWQPILPVGPQPGARTKPRAESGGNFADILAERESRVSFSKHAMQRLKDRGVDLSERQLAELGATVGRMAEKGARESLIYMDDVAFIVSVPNRTVITAMDGASAKENIFTNIDSAAIL